MNLQEKAEEITNSLLSQNASAYDLHLLLDAIEVEAAALPDILLTSSTAKRFIVLSMLAKGFSPSETFAESALLLLVERNAEALLVEALGLMTKRQQEAVL